MERHPAYHQELGQRESSCVPCEGPPGRRTTFSILALLLLCLLTPRAAWAAHDMVMTTAYGTMVEQVLATIGGTQVNCKGLLDSAEMDSAQVLCARLPAAMAGYVREGVHGRLYEYLARGTLHLARAWATVGNALRVVYEVQGGTLTIERVRASGHLYIVFEFQRGAGLAAAP
jgi:hypothetical protein